MAGPVSHFNGGVDGWSELQNFYGLSLVESPTFQATGGHPGGYISIADGDEGAGESLAAFSNFARFPGNYRSRYGGKVTFDLRAHGPNTSRRTRVMIRSSAEMLLLEAKLAKPAHSWKHYTVKLTRANWRNHENGKRVSKARFKDLLGHLAGLSVLADYTTAAGEVVDLDNPRIGPAPHHRR